MGIEILATASDLPLRSADEEQIDQARRDKEAFAAIYRQNYQAIGGYIYRRVGDKHLTDDLVADVFMAALKALARYRYRGLPVRAWLYRIATNRVNRWARRERRKANAQLVAEPQCARAPSEATRMTSDWVRTALLSLPPKYQTVIALHHLEGMEVVDIATTLGFREGTVKSRLARGREALRRVLERRSLS